MEIFFLIFFRNIQDSNPPPLTIDLRKKKKKTFKMQNEKEFVFGKEKVLLLNRFSYIFKWSKHEGTIISTTVKTADYFWCTIKVVSVVVSCESDIALITICHLNSCEIYCVCSIVHLNDFML